MSFSRGLIFIFLVLFSFHCNPVLQDATNSTSGGSSFTSDGGGEGEQGTSTTNSGDETTDAGSTGGTISTNPAPFLKIYGMLQSAADEFDILVEDQPVMLVATDSQGNQHENEIRLDEEFEIELPVEDYEFSIAQQGESLGDLHYDFSHAFSGIRTFVGSESEDFDLGTIQMMGTSEYAQFLTESPSALGDDAITDFDLSGTVDLFEEISIANPGVCSIRSTNAFVDAKLFKLANQVHINFLMNDQVQSVDVSKIYFINVNNQNVIPLTKTVSLDPDNESRFLMEVGTLQNQKAIGQIGSSFSGQLNTVSDDRIEQLLYELSNNGSSNVTSQIVEMVIEADAIRCEAGQIEEEIRHTIEVIGFVSAI